MAHALTFEHMKEIYALAVNAQRSRNWVYSIRLFEFLVEAGDPFYTPFALGGISQSYVALSRLDLQAAILKLVTQLPAEQQYLLNPGWVAFCYQRSGDLEAAMRIHLEILKVAPHEGESISALAELSLLAGRIDDAEAFAVKLQQRGEPHFQILARIVRAFALAFRNEQDEALRELRWVGQFLISSGSIPVGAWDYGDLQPLIAKTGPNATIFQVLFDALSGKISLPEFADLWAKVGSSEPRHEISSQR
jgi:hypothetical protein